MKPRRCAVLQYLEGISRFWVSGRDAIETWTLLIRAGKPVELERFKAYKYRRQTSDA